MSWKLASAACTVPHIMMGGDADTGALLKQLLFPTSALRAADNFSFTYCNVSFTVVICLL